MPCFLKVMVGSKSVADAAALSPGPESCTSMSTDVSVDEVDAHRALRAGGLGGVLHEVGQDALHQVRASVGERPARVETTESRCRVDAPLQRDPLGHERVDVNGFEHHRGIAGSEKARTRRSSASISLTTICAA